jgi:hypothetical protein
MKKIKFVKAYANVPEGTYIESENGNVFTYKNVTGENSEDYSFESSYTISFTKGEINRLIQRGVVVECVTEDEYENQLGCAIKKCNPNDEIEKLTKDLNEANKRIAIFESNEMYGQAGGVNEARLAYLERANKRLETILKRYQDRQSELCDKLGNIDGDYKIEHVELMNRIYVCDSIVKALKYVQYSNTRAKA